MDEKKTMFKQTRKAYKKAKRKTVSLWKTLAIICLVLAIVLTPVNVVLNIFDNTIVALAGGSFWTTPATFIAQKATSLSTVIFAP